MIVLRVGVWLTILFLSGSSLEAADPDLRLVQAVKAADAVTVRALLKQRVDVNARAGDGTTALHWAAYNDDPETAGLLLRAGAEIDAINDLDITPLWVASTNGHTALISLLVKAGADPNVAPSTGGTPLMITSRIGKIEAVKLLLDGGADVNASEDSHGQTALMFAVAQHHPEVAKMLLDYGADVHARSTARTQRVMICCPEFNGDSDGQIDIAVGGFTPLLFAVRGDDIRAVQLLLAAGAHVNESAPDGTSALALAAHAGFTALARILLDKGADVNASGAGYTPLHAAALRGDAALAEALLAHGANPDARLARGTPARRTAGDLAFNKTLVGATPFLLASKRLDSDLMRLLAANGANPRATLADGTTSAMLLAQGEAPRGSRGPRNDRLVEGLELVVGLGCDVNARNRAGNTAMHVAAMKKLDAAIQFLADHGATLDLQNNEGKTPLAIAMMGQQLPKGAFVVGNFQKAESPDRNTTADLLRTLGAKE